MRVLVVGLVVVVGLLVASPSLASSLSQQVDALVDRAAASNEIPQGTSLPDLLFLLAENDSLRDRVLMAADATSRSLSDSLLSTLTLSEPVAHLRLPGLYVISDFGPPVDERPPSWSVVRDVGVKLLRRIALDSTRARDLRAIRELESLRPRNRRLRPSEVGALVGVFERWWIDRGDDPALTHDVSRIPDPSDWIMRIENDGPEAEWHGLRLLADLDDEGLKTRIFLESLDEDRHAYLAAECLQAQMIDGVAFREMDIEVEHWDPEQGRMVGHRIENLRQIARDILERVTGHIPTGADAGALRNDWVYWWKQARFQARYWRDPLASPTLEPWFGGLDRSVDAGGVPVAPWVRQLYVATGFREFLLEQLGSEHQPLVAELVALLRMNREQAIAANFNLAYQRRPLLPRRTFEGEWVAIPWPEAQAFVRKLLERLTKVDVPVYLRSSPGDENRFWDDWWASERFDARWYRDPNRTPLRPQAFEMQRGRAN